MPGWDLLKIQEIPKNREIPKNLGIPKNMEKIPKNLEPHISVSKHIQVSMKYGTP
jgi:hypothetical protein